MENVYYYDTRVDWKNGRTGNLTSDGFPDIEVATPPEFKGVPGIWSPEHLFVSSVNVCLMTTFIAIAENSNLSYSSYTCYGRGKLERIEGKLMISEIELKPVITILNENVREKALRIIEKAEKACLISNSIKSKVTLLPEVIVKN